MVARTGADIGVSTGAETGVWDRRRVSAQKEALSSALQWRGYTDKCRGETKQEHRSRDRDRRRGRQSYKSSTRDRR